MAEQITITKAGIADVKLLTQLGITTFTDTFGAQNRKSDMDKYVAEEMNEDKIREEVADPNNQFFKAWLHGRLIGYAKMRDTTIPPELAHQKPAELERLYVLQQFHGHKAGAALMNHCISYAISTGHNVLWLGVWEYNLKALSFYQNWGFTTFGSHEFKLGDDIQTDVLMSLAI